MCDKYVRAVKIVANYCKELVNCGRNNLTIVFQFVLNLLVIYTQFMLNSHAHDVA